MFKFAKFLFWGLSSILLNAILFMAFGGLVAFFFLAFSREVPSTINSTSPVLAEFLNSSEKSKDFSLVELNEGVFYLILDCAKKQSLSEQNAVSAPIPPTILANGNELQLCIPFSAKIFSRNVKLGAYLTLSFNGDDVEVDNVYVGNARLPDFIAENIAESLFGFYSSIKPLKKYFDILEDCKVTILSNSSVRIEK